MSGRTRILLIVGLLALLGFWGAPAVEGMSVSAMRVAIVALVMAALWMTQAIPLAATALIPLAIFPLIGVADIAAVADAYGDPLIFLFLGGFLLAAAMARWGLHQRLALAAVAWAGPSPRALILAVMGATAFLSLWISNTATAMVMTPIAAALVNENRHAPTLPDTAPALMLGVAFAATIGGIGSLIGTPANALFAGYMRSAHGVEIGFAEWMLIGLPIVAILIPVTWLVLTRVSFRIPGAAGGLATGRLAGADTQTPRAENAPMSQEQKRVTAILVLTAVALVARPWLAPLLATQGLADSGVKASGVTDAGIAISAALLLFCVPARDGSQERLLVWADAQTIRWDVLILFGGGLALAEGIETSGLARWLGDAVSAAAGAIPIAALVLAMMIVIVYLGELASNTAMAAIFLPVSGGVAVGLEAAPIELALPVALAASLGFMLPVATPPNAIVYGAGLVTAGQMLRVGAVLDVISIIVVYAIVLALGPAIW